MENATVRMIRTVPVGIAQPTHERFHVRQIGIWVTLAVVVQKRTHPIITDLACLAGTNLIPERSRPLSDRTFTRDECVRRLKRDPAKLRRVIPKNLRETDAT